MQEIISTYESLGGRFYLSGKDFVKKLGKIKAFVFDWDGVFNNGRKSVEAGSDFSEVDSMGINLLRFGFWLRNGRIPFTAILTGMNNNIAQYFAKREHFQSIYFSFKNKTDALNHIENNFDIVPEEIAFVFDDVLDLGAASICGLRFQVKRKGNPMLNDYVAENNLVDYQTSTNGGNHALREICEMILGLQEDYTNVLENRMFYTENYEKYSSERLAIRNKGYSWKNGTVIPAWDS